MEEDMEIKYYSLSETEVGYTSQDLPEGSTEITLDTYNTILAQFDADTAASREAEESS